MGGFRYETGPNNGYYYVAGFEEPLEKPALPAPSILCKSVAVSEYNLGPAKDWATMEQEKIATDLSQALSNPEGEQL